MIKNFQPYSDGTTLPIQQVSFWYTRRYALGYCGKPVLGRVGKRKTVIDKYFGR